jgi:hypothetical protein
MNTHASGLTDVEFDDFDEIVGETIERLVACADKHNIDRDDFVKYFATIFGVMAEVSTFSQYGKEVE